MRRNYYYLAASLPELQLGHSPELGFEPLIFALKINLAPEDDAQTMVIRRYIDLQNIRSFWKGEALNHRGVYNDNELEEALAAGEGLPEYVYEFLEKYEHLPDRLTQFPQLLSAYFEQEIQNTAGFLKEYLTFERELRLVLTGFRAKLLGRDLMAELQYEDPDEIVVAQILAQKDAKTYEPPTSYADLKAVFDEHRHAPLELHRALCHYRFHRIEAMYGMELFSIDRILAYLAQLTIVEEWLELDKRKGLEVVNTILRGCS